MIGEDEANPIEYGDGSLLRRGKWTIEEENYANKIISLFNEGRLSILPGTTLRSFLSEKLQCDPMRITKKYAGKSCIGKQIYQPCEGFQDDLESIREAEKELEFFEKIFLQKIKTKAASSSSMQSPGNRSKSPPRRIVYQLTSSAGEESWKATQISEESNELAAPLTTRNRRSGLSRRNMSAPNLRSVEGQSSFFTDSLQTIQEESDEPRRSTKITEDFFLLGGRISPNQSSSFGLGTSATSSFASKKRSHSVMALMDFEKLVSDERAAGDLFFEFVTMIGQGNSSNKRHHSLDDRSSRQVQKDNEELDVSTVVLGAQGEEGGEEEGSLQSRETMVQKYTTNSSEQHFHPALPLERFMDATVASHGDNLVVIQAPTHSIIADSSNTSTLSGHDDDVGDHCDNFF